MEENKELTVLLEKIEANSRKQAKYAKWQCILSVIAAVACVAVLGFVLYLLPMLNDLAVQADTVMRNIGQVSAQLAQADWEGLISDLETVSNQMANANLGSIVEEVNGLVQSSQASLEQTMGKINSIDFETLNKAIQDLSKVVQPLANLFGR